ncbi:hypothetical protein L1887_49187 [Cichorium endivia]|nr:hypothetical protein L1887_49187 [Cichorium endivia]
MPFGASMDAWASYYDYPSDEIEIEVDDAVGSARASSELDFAETHRKSGHLSEIRLESLPPSSVPNAQLQPIDELYSQLFPFNPAASHSRRPRSIPQRWSRLVDAGGRARFVFARLEFKSARFRAAKASACGL